MSITICCTVVEKPNAILELQILIQAEWWESQMFCFFLLFTSFYKYYGGLRYPPKIWGMEVLSIVMFYLLQMMRLDLGARANRNEKKESM